ncbi:MAG: ATP-binding protein [Bacilli bacterium]|nr:ATP-binding protein [Bacilli bacterium]
MGVINTYYPRAIEAVVKKSFQNNKIVSLLGARQTGKSTVVEHLFPAMESVSLKTVFTIQSARSNPDSFLAGLGVPAFIDEVQNAPELFGSLQDAVDGRNTYSQYILSGSNKTQIDARIKESLSGRTSILEMNGLSLRELHGVSFNRHFIPTPEYLQQRKMNLKPYGDVWEYIHRGSYPELYDNPDKDWEEFYSSYVQTYIEKDVLSNIKIKDLTAFTRFLSAVAARTGGILDYQSIADNVGVSPVTIKEWLSVLIKTNIVFLLQPYYSSHLKRAIRSPKLYFKDTGLAAYLSGWLSKDQLMRGAKNGEFFETFVINELVKSFANEGLKYDNRIFFYNGKDKTKKKIKRDGEAYEVEVQAEIDFVIEENGVLYPVEIKMKDNPDVYDATAFDVLDKDVEKQKGMGIIISSNKERVQIAEHLICLPIEYI